MNQLAQYAVWASILVSLMGAAGLAAVVLRYGFISPFDSSGDVVRRVLLTRLSHAVAAVCLTVTAMLGALALFAMQPPDGPASAETQTVLSVTGDILTLDGRVKTIETSLREIDTNLGKALSRLQDLESSPSGPAR